MYLLNVCACKLPVLLIAILFPYKWGIDKYRELWFSMFQYGRNDVRYIYSDTVLSVCKREKKFPSVSFKLDNLFITTSIPNLWHLSALVKTNTS
jgi:hypothetical protein